MSFVCQLYLNKVFFLRMKQSITRGPESIKRIIKYDYENHAYKFNSLDEIDEFFKNHELPKSCKTEIR